MSAAGDPAPDRSGRWIVLAAAAALGLGVAASNLDLISGSATPYYRDIGTTHRPAGALAARLGAASLDPYASFGQAFLGNPNLVLAYPFPRAPRFLGLHFLLHLGIGLAGAFVLIRQLVRSPEAAWVGALSWGLSGVVLSSAAFLNATTTLAWIPWLLAAVLAGRDREKRLLALPGAAAASALAVLGGEPALAALGIAVAFGLALSGPAGTRRPALTALAGGGLLGLLLISPWVLEVARASAFSARRLRGFSWGEFSAVGFHPARLLETPFPYLFGDPTRIVAGAFWGYAFTNGNGPYHACLTFGVLPLALALTFVVSARRYEGRFWMTTAALGLLVAVCPWIPGARAAYDSLPHVFHTVRYPGKAILVTTLAVAVLAALATDRLLLGGALPRFSRRAGVVFLGTAFLLAAFSLAARLSPGRVEDVLRHAWDPAWPTAPGVTLGPIVRRLPVQAALAAAWLLGGSLLLARGASSATARLFLLGAVSVDLLLAGARALPRVPSAWYDLPSPLVERVRSIPGRFYERAPKNLNPVREGLTAPVPLDDYATIAVAETMQGWPLSGAVHGLRYAYEPDPDGSYTLLNRIASNVVDSRDWPRRVKWLRAVGVGSLLVPASPPVPDGVGLALEMTEARAGVPSSLYRVISPLPGVRRASRVLGSHSVNEAVASFDGAGFDPATDVVVSGPPPPGTAGTAVDPSATARVTFDSPDRLIVETDGSAPAVLHVDRSYTPRVTALVNGAAVRPLTADVHLIGVPVPAGRARVEIDLAP